MTFTFSLHHLTLADLRSRIRRKTNTDQIDTDIDGWINDVIAVITAEVPQEALISDGTDTIVGDGTSQVYSLPADFQNVLTVHDSVRNYILDEVDPQELIETWERNPVPVRDAQVYTIVGRKLGVAVVETSGQVSPLRFKFDSILPATSVYKFTYHKLHHKLVADDDPVFLDPTLHSLVVDGVMLEADAWSDHEDYERHERKFLRKLRRMSMNRSRYPNRRYVVGSDHVPPRPASPMFPSNYPSRY